MHSSWILFCIAAWKYAFPNLKYRCEQCVPVKSFHFICVFFFLIQDFRDFPLTASWIWILAHYLCSLSSCLAGFYRPMLFWDMWHFNLADWALSEIPPPGVTSVLMLNFKLGKTVIFHLLGSLFTQKLYTELLPDTWKILKAHWVLVP